MIHVTQSDIGHSERWNWLVAGLGEFAVRILQNNLNRKAAGRMVCCQNEELMLDLWFDGFPELIEQKQTMGAMYRQRNPGEMSDTQPLRKYNEKRIVKLGTSEQKRRPRLGSVTAKTSTKVAA